MGNKKIFELHNISPELNVIKAAVEDEDDLAVCILEFSEMSKIDDCVNLIIKDKNSGIPRRIETPKGSRENSPRKLLSSVSNQSFVKVSAESVVLTEPRETNLETMSQVTIDDAVSRVSEKVMSITESKISEMVESRLEEMMNKKMEETIEKRLADMQAEKAAKKAEQ